MKKSFVPILVLLLLIIRGFAQVNISTDNSSPDPSAMLDVKSTTKGVLLSRMTFAQRNAIASPAEGLAVICTNCTATGTACFSVYLGGKWINMAGSCELPASPVAGIHQQTNTSITWHWNTMPIANGYKWSVFLDYPSAIDMGTTTQKTETGLATGYSYTRYVWAYNGCGYSIVDTLNAQALSCGSSFTVSHTEGSVAPVSKTVTYGTVTNIPGEPSKCWITRNLGATQPANTVNDNTEAAAGWYWQFNRKQGYKHDGTTITPAWTITEFLENSNWSSANDPCTNLLGNAWRIPTATEWINVHDAGSWVNWNGPWSSGLQMHAAGFIYQFTGALIDRGVNGYYWSSTQNGNQFGSSLGLNNYSCGMGYGASKAIGFSVRCIRN
jgi:hypothetical protein